MPETPLDQRFEDLLRQVIDLYSTARRLRATGAIAEEILGAAQRQGEAIRRAVREGDRVRPDSSDCRILEELSGTLGAELERVLRVPAAEALRRAAAEGRAADAAAAARDLLVGLSPPPPGTDAGYLPLQVRRRARGGESLVPPQALAGEISRVLAAGVQQGVAATGGAAEALPDPIVLAPSFETCAAEIALRRSLGDLGDAVLLDDSSGDLWIFVAALAGPFGVTMAAQADDEWWAASSIRYSSYRDELRSTLEKSGVSVDIAPIA